MTEAPSVLVLGAGGGRLGVAKSLKSRGHDVLATTTQVDTDRALTCLGVEVLSWRWSPGASWADLEAFGASHWVVTVPPRGGKRTCARISRGIERLRPTGKGVFAGLDVFHGGVRSQPNRIHWRGRRRASPFAPHRAVHVGRRGHPSSQRGPFVALRFGGLFASARHPAWALSKRTPVQQADGTVQWVHEEDAANACVHVVTHDGPLASAYNVVAPDVCSRRAMLEAAWPQEACPVMEAGGVERRVLSDALESTGFSWTHPSPRSWVAAHAGVTTQGHWKGPHGRLHWTCHSLPNVPQKGVALMVHGYKGFREWGNWKGWPNAGRASVGPSTGWISPTTAIAHHSLEDCVDEEAWSQNHHHFERDEVAFALKHIESMDLPVWVMGHSQRRRGGGNLGCPPQPAGWKPARCDPVGSSFGPHGTLPFRQRSGRVEAHRPSGSRPWSNRPDPGASVSILRGGHDASGRPRCVRCDQKPDVPVACPARRCRPCRVMDRGRRVAGWAPRRHLCVRGRRGPRVWHEAPLGRVDRVATLIWSRRGLNKRIGWSVSWRSRPAQLEPQGRLWNAVGHEKSRPTGTGFQ